MSVLLGIVIVVAGIATGVLSALFGVGGGIIMVPFIVLALDKSQHLAEGTSLLVIVPTAIAGVVAHHRRGFVSFKDAAVLAIGGIGGAYLGAWLAHRLDPDALQRLFGAFVLLMGIRLVLGGYRETKGGPQTT
ncbi:MAG: sulfite exporter TauE/SafE family protein [Actinomycetota bacterium]